MGSAYEVKVVSVEEFGDNVSSESEADSAVVLAPALKIRICKSFIFIHESKSKSRPSPEKIRICGIP